MIDESLIKSNFIGRDGFRWWIGQIAPGIDEGSKKQNNGGGWGNRYKVRILGYHPYSEAELKNEDLPWAGVLFPTTSGTGACNTVQNVKLAPGDVVVGFFLDGDNAQLPIVMGAFGRTTQVPSMEYSSPFVPFTGYTDKIKNDGSNVTASETSEVRSQSPSVAQPSPRGLSQQQVDEVNANRPEGTPPVLSQSTFHGMTVTPADTCDDNFIGEVTGIFENLLSVIGEATNFLQDVQSTVRKIQNLTNNVVGTLFNSLYNALIPLIQKGLKLLYQSVYDAVFAVTQSIPAAHAAGVAAQQEMIVPVKELQDAMTCVASKIVEGLGETIANLVEKTLMEVVNFGLCVAEQFVSNLLNGIIDQISSGLDSFLGAIDNILKFVDFNLTDFLRSSINTFKAIGGLFDCGQNNAKCKKLVKKWTIGYGPQGSFDLNKTYDRVLNQMNYFAKIGIGATSDVIYSRPGCNIPTSCGSPTVSFFGGDGIGAAGKAILGDFVSNVGGLSDVTAAVTQTASIIGVKIEDPGKGYYNAPPLVSFSDSCNLGYGAIGRAIVDYNRKSNTYGQVIGVYMISTGENYPAGSVDIQVGSDISTESDNIPFGVTSIFVVSQGTGYSVGDIAFDDIGNEYELTIDNGRIITVGFSNTSQLNIIKTQTLPEITINTSTGRGAILKPIIGRLPVTPQGKVEQVIDCIT